MHKHHSHRRGLAMLELVLALPILLFVMALMVNFGMVACWKVRGLNMARNAVWSTRWPQSGAANPRPDFWPVGAGAAAGGAGNVPENQFTAQVDQPVARGPLPPPPNTVGPVRTTVNSDLLDPTRGLREGSATLTRGFAMLAKMGTYHLKASTTMLDDRWQYGQMAWQFQGSAVTLPSNDSLRIPIIYAIETAAARYAQAYVQAIMAILYMPARQTLYPLDRDDEFIAYGQIIHLVDPRWQAVSPDFHPQLNRFCSPVVPSLDDL